MLPLPRSALPSDTVTLARFLLGKVLVRELDGAQLMGRIVETEAYVQNDPACHRCSSMWAMPTCTFATAPISC